MMPMQLGDVKSTFADMTLLKRWINYEPVMSFENGIYYFAKWFKEYFDSEYYKDL